MQTIFSDADNQYMVANYQTMTYKDIAAHLGFTERQIRGHLNNMGLTKKTSQLRENYFDIIDTPEKSYFLGLMFADGYVVYNPQRRNYEATLSLEQSDSDTVTAYAQALGIADKIASRTRTISFNGYTYDTTDCSARAYSRHLCDALINLGVVPNKTYCPEFPRPSIYLSSFVRGFLDGDGCIYNGTDGKSLIVSFTNSNREFLAFLRSLLLEQTGAVGSLYTEKEWKHRLMFYSPGDSLAVLAWIYQPDGAWKMERKYQKYQTHLGLAA